MAELTLNSLEDIQLLQESAEVECKLACGRDGKGAVPNDMWETYSAFANTRGGVILLGIKEKRGQFTLEGIANPAPLVKNIVDTVNNPNKVSGNLLSERDVCVEVIEGKSLIRIDVPRAPRKERPIYINGNPITGSFVRRYEADQKCSADTVKQMMAEQENERDQRILEHFTIDDIEPESLRVYRQMFKDAKPQHPFLELSDQEFLRSIRAWRRDRASGIEGLTLAGLVMFGRWDALQDAFPAYSLDYQEKDDSSHRWIDRIYTDGSWSGNAFNFYRKVYRKLTADLKVSFQLSDGQRLDTSPAHEAIREALVNTLAHADFDSEDNILIEKHPDFIGFRNPGLMRIPVQEAIAGGNSQCRNPAIHQMFLNIGLSEKAGSGIPKIYSNCRSQNWQPPHLYEKHELGQTLLELRMVNILSPELHQQLVDLFGENYKQLSELKRTILVTAVTESWFNHERICSLTSEHTREVTLALSQLVSAGYLNSAGKHKGKIYHLKGIEVPTPDNDAGKSISFVASPSAAQLSLFEPEPTTLVPDLKNDAPDLVPDLKHDVPDLNRNAPESTSSFTAEDQQLWAELRAIAQPVLQQQGRKNKPDVKNIILVLCAHAAPNCLRLSDLAELLGMNTETLRRHYLSPMVKEQQLYLAFPTVPNHPEQGYTTQNNTKLD
ncbi:putative DNA binding domain-containing protein [Vibrio aestuarianus]|uniref:DNA binding domain-containing protein n=1 Tax=Vibrio aestuarianus TaxID=28171 RepID=A0A9X4J0U0_9VIBR|nr:ATP-binding protein [Vibrio aestuarianus]MDE1309916.1 putative DNA binding domain-containing protein [Vibrio aestuarianus]MDE1357858.1 putative DNA binding domain-containing protein [Vibrio aestuarianus]NGZ18328.1 AAA family ATPase [Vibrio aestuarianus]NGZ93158.1 AAA family ATPase [Vibrio aestuarianus subsp. cardii]